MGGFGTALQQLNLDKSRAFNHHMLNLRCGLQKKYFACNRIKKAGIFIPAFNLEKFIFDYAASRDELRLTVPSAIFVSRESVSFSSFSVLDKIWAAFVRPNVFANCARPP